MEVQFTEEELAEFKNRVLDRAETHIMNQLIDDIRRSAQRDLTRKLYDKMSGMAYEQFQQRLEAYFTEERVHKLIENRLAQRYSVYDPLDDLIRTKLMEIVEASLLPAFRSLFREKDEK